MKCVDRHDGHCDYDFAVSVSTGMTDTVIMKCVDRNDGHCDYDFAVSVSTGMTDTVIMISQ
jgi:hypothetical protein